MTVYIVKRKTKAYGARFSVRCELPNRPIIHLGTYSLEPQAKARKLAAINVIAKYARDSDAYDELTGSTEPAPAMPLGETAAAWLETLLDLAKGTRRSYEQSVSNLPEWLLALDRSSVTHADVQRFVSERGAKRGTISKELGVLRQILAYADVTPNPASDTRVRLPRGERKTYRLPTRVQIAELHAALESRIPLMTLLEHTGLRIEEAAALRWCDIDHTRKTARLLVTDAKTAAGVRFVEHLPGTPPFPRPEEGAAPEALVFAKPSPSTFTGVLAATHKRRGTFLMSSHEFRHLAASRWLHEGILSPAQIAARLGHATPAITLSVYAHIVPPD